MRGGALGAVELVEIEHALECGERPRSMIADDYGVSPRTIERVAAAMRRRGQRVRPVAPDMHRTDVPGGWRR